MVEDSSIENAELWAIEPPENTPDSFVFAIRYLINAGVDLAIGPNYTLPRGVHACMPLPSSIQK